MTIRNRRQGKLPFALSWWAFVFPIGACSVLAYRVSELLALEVLPLVASGLTLLALFVWSATALGTVRGIRTGAIFAPRTLTQAASPPPSPPPQGPSATMAQGPFFLSTPRASSIRIILRFHRTSPPPIPAHLAPFACSSRVRRPPNSPPLSHFISRFLVRLTTSTFGISSD